MSEYVPGDVVLDLRRASGWTVALRVADHQTEAIVSLVIPVPSKESSSYGTCRLCRADGVQLRVSHILPKWTYRIARNDGNG